MAPNDPNNVILDTDEWAAIHLNYNSDDQLEQTRAYGANTNNNNIEPESNNDNVGAAESNVNGNDENVGATGTNDD